MARKITLDRRTVARHEAAHAVAHHFLPLTGTTTGVTIHRGELSAMNEGAHEVNRADGFHRSKRTLPPVRRGRVEDPEQLAQELIAILAGDAAMWIGAGLSEADAPKPTPGEASEWAANTDGGSDVERAFALLFEADPFDRGAVLVRQREGAASGESIEEIKAAALAMAREHSARVVERFEQARREAHAFCVAHWPHIVALADHLLAKQRLDADAVREIIEAVEDRVRSGPPLLGFDEGGGA